MPSRVIEVKIQGDASGATAPLKSFSSLLSSLTGIASAPTKALDGLITTAAKIGLAAQGVGMLIGAVQSLGSAMSAPITAASNLAESMNKTEVVFGASADAVKRFAETAATGLGQSQQTALEAAGTFGNLFTSMGLGQKPAADLSVNIVKLASDLASFNNIKPEEALEKLRAGLVGEVEPLRTVGVNLNALAVEAKATAMGFVDANGVVTEAGKVQARYALILEQTKNAQGDFARTADDFANAQRIVSATFTDINAKIGNAFLPTIARLTTAFAATLPDALNVMQPYIDKFGIALDAGARQVQGFIAMVQNISRDHGLNGFQATIAAIEIKLREVFGDRAANLFHNLQVAGDKLWSAMAAAVGPVSRLASAAASLAFDGLQAIAAVAPGVFEKIRDAIGWIGDHEEVVRGMTAAYIALVAANAMGKVPGAIESIGASLLKLNPLMLVATAGIAAYAYGYGSNFSGMKERTDAFVGFMGDTLKSIPKYIGDMVQEAQQQWAYFIHNVRAVGDSVGPIAIEVGQSIINGIIQGLQQGPLTGPIMALGAFIGAKLRESVGAHSPADVGIEVGEAIDEGVAVGIENATGRVAASIEELGVAMGASFDRATTLIEKENDDYLTRLENSDRKHNRRVLDIQQELATAKPKERKALLDKIKELEEDHTNAVEDIERTHSDNLIDAEMKMARERGAAILQFSRDAEDAAQDAADRIVAINDRQASAMQSAMDDALSNMADARARASEQIDNAITGLRDNRAARGVSDAFGGKQDKAARDRQDAKDQVELTKRINEEEQKLTERFNEATSDLTHRRGLEDAEERRSLDKDLAGAKTDDERREIQDRHAATRDELREKRTLEDTERRYQYDQDKRATDIRVAEMRAEFNERKKAAEDDRLFREGQATARQAFEDQLDTDALTAAITRINTERDQRIASITEALAAKQAAIVEDADKERAVVIDSLNKKIEDLKTHFIDKLGPLTATAQGVLNTFMDSVAGRVANITSAALAAAAALAQIGSGSGGGDSGYDFTGAANNIGSSVGNAVANAIAAGATAAQTAAALLNAGTAATGIPGAGANQITGVWNPSYSGSTTGGYATGTLRVPGKPGEARMVEAHGGERISSWTGPERAPIIVTGNIILGDDQRVAAQLARIIKPHLDYVREVGVAG